MSCPTSSERLGSSSSRTETRTCFELTNPERFNAWLDEQNRVASLHLVQVIRLIKYLRDFKGTFGVKSIILTTLLGNAVNFVEHSSATATTTRDHADGAPAFRGVTSNATCRPTRTCR